MNNNEVKMDPLQKQMLDDVFDAFSMLSGGNMISLMHVGGGFTRYSANAVELFDLPGEYIPNGADDWTSHVHPEDRKHYLDVMTPLAMGETFHYDLYYRVITRSGEYARFRFVGATLRDDDGKPSLIGGMIVNEGFTETTDSVTILRNQYAFYPDVDGMLDAGEKVTVLLFGISGMTRMNRLYGYGFGNRILQELAWMLQENAKECSIYRMEGVTFAVVSTKLGSEDMTEIYNSLRQKLRYGIKVDGQRITLNTNGALVVAEGKLRDSRAVYTCANFAYNESKTHRHGELVPYESAPGKGEKVTLEVIDEIRTSVINGCEDFYLNYQPVKRLDGKVAGVEVLVRWMKDPEGDIFPGRFLSVLEGDYVFDELGSWVMEKAMQEGLKLIEKQPDLLIGVNIFSIQLEDQYFSEGLHRVMKRTGFPAKNLCLELTEGCRLLELDYIRSVIEPLQEEGISIIIDDYGKGFDSLISLKKLKPSCVKYDIGLMEEFKTSDADKDALRGLSKSIIAYGSTICVKGVDDKELYDELSELQVSSVQGDYCCKPLTVDEMLEKL